ncbi:MAG: UvrD-helicase domain-containing protein [Rhodospirillales bacterium]|nr:UvrD-helicase domain-containing protein [Rhodospirillales bacterium]
MQSQPNHMPEPPYLSGLNEKQREAVLTTEGPLLVLAGAGTGKTRVLTTRLAHIIQSGRAWPGQILAVTFTNKAAQEMRHRVGDLLGQDISGMWLGTFHALAARMLRRYADRIGLSSNFTIIDPDDQVRLMKQLMESQNLDTKKWPPKVVISKIDRFKDQGLKPTDLKAENAGDFAGGALISLYALYQSRLKTINACDFGDLLLHMMTILKDPQNRDILEEFHRRFKYILVDEYQDTNVAQYLWLRLLAQGSKNICCVGDDDQSIYGWRGAEVGNILRFEKDFDGAKIIRLEENYRSTNTILSAANAVIAHNEQRLGKELFSAAGDGEKIIVRGLWDGEAEARWVAEEVEQLQRKKHSLNDMAVLVRATFQMREFEERFIQLGIAYRVVGGARFFERMEIRDALAYFRVVAQPQDDLALERIINTPKRGIGDGTVQKLYAHARQYEFSLYEAIRDITQTDILKGKTKSTLMVLIDDFERWRDQLDKIPHPELAQKILEESGYLQMWQEDKSPESPGRIENLKELVSAMAEFESFSAFLEHVALVLENQDNQNSEQVTLMTLHGAKGLEFPVVFLPGWEEGLFPSQRSMDETGLKGLEEERRLAYVGLTRARARAYVSYAGSRRMYGNWINAIPSRFVDELPPEHIDTTTETGLYGPGRSKHWDSSGFDLKPSAPPADRFRVMPRQGNSFTTQKKAAKTSFSRGDRVFHESFGEGNVVHVDGRKLDIQFATAGLKRIMDAFVEKVS